MSAFSLDIVYDNKSCGKGSFESGHGLSSLIQKEGKKILFDTGEDGRTLKNLKKILKGVREIDALVFSHFHDDHTGGALPILEEIKVNRIFIPYCFPSEFKDKIKKTGTPVIETGRIPVEIFQEINITPLYRKLKKPAEQVLMINTAGGLLVLCGCAHAGVVKIIRKIKKETDEKIRFVAGGFHFYCLPSFIIKRQIKLLEKESVESFFPCHCTGEKGTKIFKKKIQEKTNVIRAGDRLEF